MRIRINETYERGRDASFTVANGGLVIYDTRNHCAWLLSDTTLPIEA